VEFCGKRLLYPPSAARLWGLQFAFLNPALALLLVTLFDATAAEVGWVLVSGLALIGSGCVAGIVFYTGMAYAPGPTLLIGLQVPNAWFFAAAGVSRAAGGHRRRSGGSDPPPRHVGRSRSRRRAAPERRTGAKTR
jgi:hypothetical protein